MTNEQFERLMKQLLHLGYLLALLIGVTFGVGIGTAIGAELTGGEEDINLEVIVPPLSKEIQAGPISKETQAQGHCMALHVSPIFSPALLVLVEEHILEGHAESVILHAADVPQLKPLWNLLEFISNTQMAASNIDCTSYSHLEVTVGGNVILAVKP